MSVIPKEFFTDEPRRMLARVFEVEARDETSVGRDGQERVVQRVYLGLENPVTGKALPTIRYNLSRTAGSPWRQFCKAIQKLGFDPDKSEFESWIVGKTFRFEQKNVDSAGGVSFSYWVPVELVESAEEEDKPVDLGSIISSVFSKSSVLGLEEYMNIVENLNVPEEVKKRLRSPFTLKEFGIEVTTEGNRTYVVSAI